MEPITFAGDLDDFGVVQEAVEDGGRGRHVADGECHRRLVGNSKLDANVDYANVARLEPMPLSQR